MAATGMFFEGEVQRTPGVRSRINADKLGGGTPTGIGRMAIVGTGKGGVPVSAYTSTDDLIRYKSDKAVLAAFSDGDLREAGAMAFDASADDAINRAPTEVFLLQCDPDTASTLTLSAALGTSLALTSRKYGADSTQINVTVASGTNKGKNISVIFEATLEPKDDLGGTPTGGTGQAEFSLEYTEDPTGSGRGWDTMTAQVTPNGAIRAFGTRTETGLGAGSGADFTNGGPTAPANLEPGSVVTIDATSGSNTADATAGHKIQVYGETTGGAAQRETIAIPSNTTGTGLLTWGRVLAAVIVDANGVPVAASGAVLVRAPFVTTLTLTTFFTFAATNIAKGAVIASTMFVSGALGLAASAATVGSVQLWGRSAGGAVLSEKLTISGTAARYVPFTTTTFKQIDVIVLGAIASGTVTIAGYAAKIDTSLQTNLQKAADYFNDRQTTVSSVDYGFEFINLSGKLTRLVTTLDATSAGTNGVGSSIKSAAVSFYADLDAMRAWFGSSSQLASAARIAFVPQSDVLTFSTTSATVTINGTAYSTSGNADAAATVIAMLAQLQVQKDLAPLIDFAAGTTTAKIQMTSKVPNPYTVVGTTNVTVQSSGAGTVAVSSGVGIVPSNQGPVFMTGGTDVAATITDYRLAYEWLKKIKVDSIALLSASPAAQLLHRTHLRYMRGKGADERDGGVGLQALDDNGDPTGELPTKASIKSQIVDVGDTLVRAFAQGTDRIGTDGTRQSFTSWAQAVLVLAMQNGAALGEPMTNKRVNALKFTQDASWDPIVDSEEMIEAGLCFGWNIDGEGRYIVRNITTNLAEDNIAFTEASVVQILNIATKTLRIRMKRMIGRRGTQTTVNLAGSVATAALSAMVSPLEIITSYANPIISLLVDILSLSVEMAPVSPVNFVDQNIHLATNLITAQAA